MAEQTARRSRERGGNLLRLVSRGMQLELRMLGLLVVLGLILSFVSPYFLTMNNIANVMDQSVVTGIVAIGQTFVILTAGIDLSVGSLVGVTGIAFGLANQSSGLAPG